MPFSVLIRYSMTYLDLSEQPLLSSHIIYDFLHVTFSSKTSGKTDHLMWRTF